MYIYIYIGLTPSAADVEHFRRDHSATSSWVNTRVNLENKQNASSKTI